jgi:hypothetical protein
MLRMILTYLTSLFLFLFISESFLEKYPKEEFTSNCKSLINEWEWSYIFYRKTIPRMPIDNLISVAINVAKILPSYLYRLDTIRNECKRAIQYQDAVIENNKSAINTGSNEEFQKIDFNNSNNSLINNETFRYLKSVIDSNNNEYIKNINCFIHNAEFLKIIESLQLQQRDLTMNLNKIILSELGKMFEFFPAFYYLKRQIEAEMKIDFELNLVSFKDLEIFNNKLVHLIQSSDIQTILAQMKTSQDELRNAKKLISFTNILLVRYIRPIVELSDNKLNFSNSIYHNCEISEIKMRYICNIGIIDDIKETHELCSWLSKLIGNYFSILVNYYNLMRTDTFNSFKNNGIRD